MEYTKQTWTAPTGTGLSRYAKSGETETHVELALDPVNLTNTPTPFTMARMAYMEDGIAKAYDTAPPTPWAQYSGKDIPQLPDNVAGRTYFQDEWATTDGWTSYQGTLSVTPEGQLKSVATVAGSFTLQRTMSFTGKVLIIKIKGPVGSNGYIKVNIATTKQSFVYNGLWQYFAVYVSEAVTNISLTREGGSPLAIGDVLLLDFIYIGTGAYDRLVFDNSYHYRHLLNNAVIPTSQGLYFNGTTSYLRSKEPVTLPDVFTFSATVNCATSSSVYQRIFDIYNNATSFLRAYRNINQNENSVTVSFYNTSSANAVFYSASNFFVDNIDIDIKIEIDFINKTLKIYKNNILFYSITVTGIQKPTEGYLYIGDSVLIGSKFLGYMRNICLFDTALTDTQRNWLAQGNTPPILYDVTNYETEGYVSIQDADGTNTGAETYVDSNGNRILKLPATIKANVSGNLTGNVTGNVSGNAGTATKLATPRTINGVSFDGSTDITVADATKAPIAHASAATTYGVSSEANYGHAKASTVAGSANGTASKGTTPAVFAQSNHVHPLQTAVSGNAATADKWKTARNITISDADGTNTGTAVVVDGSENETLKLPATIKANVTGNADTASKANVRVSLRHGNEWFFKTFTGLTEFIGSGIWTDGDNIYHSNAAAQDVLNKSTSSWVSKIWAGLTDFNGSSIWTDGDNIYYSNATTQYVLNKATSTWSAKVWTGLTNFDGKNIWTDGANIYYSIGTTHYMLNKSTSTWVAKTWAGLTNLFGSSIWTDGDNIYYSESTTHYMLNKSTSTWVVKTWAGLTDFNGDNIWTDGDNIYYSIGTTHYMLNKSTSTWVAKTWAGLTDFNGFATWTDGDNIYYSIGTNQFVLPATRHNYVDDDKYNSLFGTVTRCKCSTLSDRFVFRNE